MIKDMPIKVIVHCSDSSFGNAAEITKWHVVERGFTTIGYHYVILNGWLSSKKYHRNFDGHLETGRALDDDSSLQPDEVGAHTLGNNLAVGVCLIGKSGLFTPPQLDTLRHLIKELRIQYNEVEVFQHSDFELKKPFCAGLKPEVMQYMKRIGRNV